MKKALFWTAIAIAIAVTISFVGWKMHQRRVIRAEFRRAYRSIQTVREYSTAGITSMAQADLQARGRLELLEDEDLNTNEILLREELSAYLTDIESLASSHSIETANARSAAVQKDEIQIAKSMKTID